MDEAATELFDVLCRRAWVLAELREGAATETDLAAASDVSRTTVRPGLADLAAVGLIESTDDGERHALTLTGRVVHDQFRQSTDQLLGIDRAAPWLAALPRSTPLDPRALEAATVREGEAARDRCETLAADATSLSGWSLARRPEQVRPLLSGGATLDLVVTPALLRTALEASRSPFLDRLAADDVTVHEAADLPAYSLVLATVDDRRRLLLGFHEDGALVAIVETDRRAAVEWGVERVEDCRERATPIGSP